MCHLVGRWEWRRRKLRRFKTHVPGDKSFKCKVRKDGGGEGGGGVGDTRTMMNVHGKVCV